jgi:transglutaminase-like putative cysteine protease
MLVFLHSGSDPLANDYTPSGKTKSSYAWDLQKYTALLKQNMENTDKRYSKQYIPYDFIVDTDYGSTLIQNLIEPSAVSSIIGQLEIENLDNNEKLLKIYDYVLQNYAFVLDPYNWPAVEETIRRKRGDCNSLSLLLMSLLQAAGIDTYAGISNGHMWVYAFHHNHWQLLEVDQDPERKKIYSLPGFYDNPVYKIFIDHSEKRSPFRSS